MSSAPEEQPASAPAPTQPEVPAEQTQPAPEQPASSSAATPPASTTSSEPKVNKKRSKKAVAPAPAVQPPTPAVEEEETSLVQNKFFSGYDVDDGVDDIWISESGSEQVLKESLQQLDEEYKHSNEADQQIMPEPEEEEDDDEDAEREEAAKQKTQRNATLETERLNMAKKFQVKNHLFLSSKLASRYQHIKGQLNTDFQKERKKNPNAVQKEISFAIFKVLVGQKKYAIVSSYEVKAKNVTVDQGFYVFYIDDRHNDTECRLMTFKVSFGKEKTSLRNAFMAPIGTHLIIATSVSRGEGESKNDSDQEARFYYINTVHEEIKYKEKLAPLKKKNAKEIPEHLVDIPTTSAVVVPDVITSVAWHPTFYSLNSFDNLKDIAAQVNNFEKGLQYNERLKELISFVSTPKTLLLGTSTAKIYSIKYLDKETGFEKAESCFDVSKLYEENRRLRKTIYPITGLEIVRYQGKTVIVASSAVCCLMFEFDEDLTGKQNYHEFFNNVKLGTKPLKSIWITDVPDYEAFPEEDEIPLSEFTLMRNTEVGDSNTIENPTAFSWTTKEGVIHGDFLSDLSVTTSEKNYTLLSHHTLGIPEEDVFGIIISDFHIYLLFANVIRIVMQPPELKGTRSETSLLSSIVYSNSVPEVGGMTRKFAFRGMTKDHYRRAGASADKQEIIMYTSAEIFLLDRQNNPPESKAIWRVYLEQATNPSLEDLREEYYNKARQLAKQSGEIECENAVNSALGDYFCEKPLEYKEESKKFNLERAAEAYAETNRSFEEIVSKLMEKDPKLETKALMIYLDKMLGILNQIAIERKAENYSLTSRICMSTWLVELHLHRINVFTNQINTKFNIHCSIKEREKQVDRIRKAIENRKAARKEFRDFLTAHKQLLSHTPNDKEANKQTGNDEKEKKSIKDSIYELIESHGLHSDSLYFASLIGDYRKVIRYLISKGLIAKRQERQLKANEEEQLAKLRAQANTYFNNAYDILLHFCTDKEKHHDEIWYDYAPTLMSYLEGKKEDLLEQFKTSGILSSERLVPSILRFVDKNNERTVRSAIDYLAWATKANTAETSRVIHNFFVLLHTLIEDDDNVLNNALNFDAQESMYDRDFAARVCKAEEKHLALVNLYSAMGLYETAVEYALKNPENLGDEVARTIVDKIDKRNKDLRQQLLIKIIVHLVEKDKGSAVTMDGRRKAMEYLSDYSDIVKLSDVLKLFPIDTKMEPLVEQLKRSLSRYGEETKKLQQDMYEATNEADLIREAIKNTKIEKELSEQDKCDGCDFTLTRPNEEFVVFSCGHQFHQEKCLRPIVIETIKQSKNYTEEQVHLKVKQIHELSLSLNKLKEELRLGQYENAKDKLLKEKQQRKQSKDLLKLLAHSCPYCGVGKENVKGSKPTIVDLIKLPVVSEPDPSWGTR